MTKRLSPRSLNRIAQNNMEMPGTAPGSTTFIPRAVYRHSRQAGKANIGFCARI